METSRLLSAGSRAAAEFRRSLRRFAIVPGIACFAWISSASAQTILTPDAGSRFENVQFEQELVLSAVALAGKGDIAGAWELLAADGAAPRQMGFRLVAVAGALRNQNNGDEAVALTRLGLSQGWCDVRKLRAGKERGDVSYWCAWLAAEIVGDRKLADRWAAQAELDDPGSERVRQLRRRLADAQRAFPGN